MEVVLQGMRQLVHMDTPEKLKGLVSCQSSLQRSRVPLQARVGKEPQPGQGTARPKSIKAAELPSGVHGDERGENSSSGCSGTGLPQSGKH